MEAQSPKLYIYVPIPSFQQTLLTSPLQRLGRHRGSWRRWRVCLWRQRCRTSSGCRRSKCTLPRPSWTHYERPRRDCGFHSCKIGGWTNRHSYSLIAIRWRLKNWPHLSGLLDIRHMLGYCHKIHNHLESFSDKGYPVFIFFSSWSRLCTYLRQTWFDCFQILHSNAG